MPIMSKDLQLSEVQIGWVFSAFGIAYAVFEIPGGWMGDWIGARKVLMRIVIWWSAFTAATGYMWSFASLIFVRFWFGAGEAGCFPNLTKAFSVWLPAEERVRAQGIMWTFARWGGAFTGPLVVAVFKIMSWRTAFVAFGLLGVVWAVIFYRWYRDDPMEHPSVNAGERELLATAEQGATGHGNVPWGKLIASRSVWLLWLQYFLLAFPWYFYITWLPKYLQDFRKVSPEESGWLTVFPLFFGGMGALFCGFVSPRVARAMGSVARSRRWIAVAGFFGAGTLLLISIQIADPLLSMIAMGLASFCNDLVMPGAWAACMDIGGKYAGTLAGSMNMMGNMAGFVAPVVGGYILAGTGGNYNVFLYVMAAVYFLGTLTWPFIDPVTPLEQSS
jgi:MFS family permease